MRRAWGWFLVLALCAGIAPYAHAQDDDEQEDSASADPEQANEADEPHPEPKPPETAPTWWLGAYVQGAFVPSFMLGLFAAEAPGVNNLGFGVTATHRDADGMSLVLGLGYQSYAFDGAYRVKNDPELDTEYLESTLGLLHLRAQVLWSTEIVHDTLSFEYGVGLDVGLVLGSLKRTEAYADASGYHPCVSAGVPASPYCELPINLAAGTDAYNQNGAHYHVTEKSVPPVMAIPMLPALALRYTPIRQLAIKLDAAFGLLQFAVGLSAAYGLD